MQNDNLVLPQNGYKGLCQCVNREVRLYSLLSCSCQCFRGSTISILYWLEEATFNTTHVTSMPVGERPSGKPKAT